MIQYILTEQAKQLRDKGWKKYTPGDDFPEMVKVDVTPKRGTPNSAGLDLSACIFEPVTIYPGTITKIPTGIKLFLGENFRPLTFYTPEEEYDILFSLKLSGFYLPRSSNTELVLTNTVGTLDCDYQGESFLKVTAREHSFTINPGDKIAQLVITLAVMNNPIEVESFESTTIRGEGGDGSTGGNYVHK